MTKRLVTVPGDARDVYVEDILALLPGGTPASVGLPPGCDFSIQTEDRGGVLTAVVIRVTPRRVLPEGHVYLMQPADVIQELVKDNVPDPTGAIAWRLARTAGAAAATALGRLNFVPLVYVAGPVQRSTTMPRPAHCRLTYSGIFGSTTAPIEIWSYSLTFLDLADHGGTTQALADKAQALYMAGPASLVPSSVTLTRTRVAFMGDGAHVNRNAAGAFDQADNLTAVPGSYQQSGVYPTVYPLQSAVAVSFYSARQGATGRGRCFVPLQGPPLDGGSFLISSDVADSYAIRIRDVARGMESPGDGGPHVGEHAVMSSKGYSSVVTEYRCGRVPDTMRSRRNALKEAYRVEPATTG